jgi:hypothetical protein
MVLSNPDNAVVNTSAKMPIQGMKRVSIRTMPNTIYLSEAPWASATISGAVCAALASVDPLPHIPTMAATSLQLELLLQESSIDLKAVSELILSDAGATLQVLRLIGVEFAQEETRPTRIEDCIASLNTEYWYEEICTWGVSQSGPLIAEWQQCRRIAECARELACRCEGFSPDEAYIVGLLHKIGTFPYLLGWNGAGGSLREQRILGITLAKHWNLPSYLVSAVQEHQDAIAPARWTELLQMATKLTSIV